MSSRNVYLSPGDRRAASVLSRALRRAEDMVRSGERDPRTIRDAVLLTITSEPRLILDYAAIVTEETFEDPETIDKPVLLLVAARVGHTRLIDNAILIPEEVPVPEHLRELVREQA
jgi:pantoate--beta-alanine ligase